MTVQDAVVVVRVLYIDDDPALARLVQRHLQREGCEVHLAANGPSGVSMAACGGYDVIALDHYMPGQDGLETLAELQKQPGLPPVVFVTGAEEPRIAVTAMRNGAADYVVKDVQGGFLPTLDAAIRRALEQERVRRDKEAAERALRESRDNLERLALQQAILLREVNHRVANSLQLISSLIDLQVRKLHDTEARDVLRQAAARVEAVSLVHRRLYTSSDVQFVELDQYVAGLVEELRRATASGTGAERIELRTEPIRVETDKAVSIGLIVNELVTNALKYAYPGRTEGIVRVALVRESGGGMTLSVEDDGVGLPETGLVSKGTGLGSMIVSAMAQTIGASVALERRSPGTRIAVRMALKAA